MASAPIIADYTARDRTRSYGGHGRDLPNPRTEAGATLQHLALGDPHTVMAEVRRLWPDLWQRTRAQAVRENVRPYAMLFDLIERGLDASEDLVDAL